MMTMAMMILILLPLIKLLLDVRDINNKRHMQKERKTINAYNMASIKMVGLVYG